MRRYWVFQSFERFSNFELKFKFVWKYAISDKNKNWRPPSAVWNAYISKNYMKSKKNSSKTDIRAQSYARSKFTLLLLLFFILNNVQIAISPSPVGSSRRKPLNRLFILLKWTSERKVMAFGTFLRLPHRRPLVETFPICHLLTPLSCCMIIHNLPNPPQYSIIH